MKISLAQLSPVPDNFIANISKHCALAKEAASEGADLILFPEMSLTGYLREGADKFGVTVEDERLQPLRQVSKDADLTLAVGAPLSLPDGLYIATLIVMPTGAIKYYLKRNLHEGEDAYFLQGNPNQEPVTIAGKKVWFAICSDINNPKHFYEGVVKGCDVIASSIFYSKEGVSKAHAILKENAGHYKVPIVMSNFTGYVWGMDSGGKSAAWNSKGISVLEMAISEEGQYTIYI